MERSKEISPCARDDKSSSVSSYNCRYYQLLLGKVTFWVRFLKKKSAHVSTPLNLFTYLY